MTEREQAVLWLDSFMKNEEPLVLIPKQLIRLMYDVLKNEKGIIRCKDCKHWDADDHECNIKTGWFACGADWYCADGERKCNWFCADGGERQAMP